MIETINAAPKDAILLCGSDGKPGSLGGNKSLLEIGGRDILEGTLEALDSAQFVDRVFVIGPKTMQNRLIGRQKEYELIEPQGDIIKNVSAGIEKQQQRGGDQHILIVCSDLPFLTSKSLDWLVVNAQPKDNNEAIKLPVVPYSQVQKLSSVYETYYYPMKEFSFKMGNNLFIDINLLNEERINLLVKKYRQTGSDNYLFMSLKRMALLQRYGGNEAVYTLLVNYVSKMLQVKYGTKHNVPLSGLRQQIDYQRVLSKMLNHKTELLPAPFVDMVLDVDSATRFGIFQRGYERISAIVQD